MFSKHNYYKLSNNLRILHIPKKSNIITIGFVVKVGSRDEDETLNGISHFLEHMSFKKTKNRSTNKLLEDLDSYGAYYNASTSFEFTSFEIHGNKKDFFKLLDILIDIYINPKILKKDIEVERGVITEEYNMGLNSVDNIIFDNLFYSIFGNTGLGRPIIGTRENIQNFTRQDIVGYRNIFYNYLNTIFVLIGDIKKDLILDFIEKKLGKITTTNFLNNREQININQIIPRLNITNTNKSLGQIYLLFGFTFEGIFKKNNNLNEQLISNIITSGSSSKLWNLLRTKMGVAYSVSSNSYEFEDNTIFTIKSSVEETRVVESITKILDILNQLRNGKISNKDLIRAKKIYCNYNEINMNDQSILFDYYSFNAINNLSLESPLYDCDKVNKIKLNSIITSCKQIFKKNNLNLAIVGKLKADQKNEIINLLDNWYCKKN